VKVESGPAIAAEAGEIVLLPRNEDHVLASDLAAPPVLADPYIVTLNNGLAKLAYGGGGARTEIYCGYLGHDSSLSALLALLPSIMKLNVRQVGSAEWMESTFRYAARQPAGGPAQPAMIARMAELLFIEGLREHLAAHPSADRLRGSRDAAISRALALMEAELSRAWTTEDLAEAVGMSRSAFADRFTRVVGAPPMRYLGQRRLEEASRRLCETGDLVANIAFSVGFESEAAFTRSFKRTYGSPPSAWRKRRAPAPPR
jgi:AraC-like DNA-binding protein